MKLTIQCHAGNPNMCRIPELKIRAMPECEGGGWYMPREQAEAIVAAFPQGDRDVMSSAPGDRVKFAHSDAGYPLDQQTADKHLVVGQTYTVDSVEVGNWHTDVWLREVPGVAFNSVMFDAA